jgi:tetratricopeptide (TPR) repeat protein
MRLNGNMKQPSGVPVTCSKLRFLLPITLVLLLVGCKTTKKKDDISGLGMFYQNMTAHYNGHFNATELMKESVLTLETEHKDNYNQLLPVFEYNAVGDPKSVSSNLDEIIKKASVNISLHRPSRWTDDSYLIIGQSQYMKQDYESAQKTLEYMINNFDETGKSKTRSKKKPSKAKAKAERQKQILAKSKEIEARKKEAAKDRKERNKEITEKKKSQAKIRKAAKKERDKANKARAKKRKKANAARKKNRNKGSKKRKKKVPYIKSEPKKEETPQTKTEDKKESVPTPKVETLEKKTPLKSNAADEEKEKKKKQPEKEEDIKKKEKDEKIKSGALAHKPAYQYGVLWLAKTYVERDFIIQADRLFRQVEQSNTDDKELKEELYPSMADYYIYTENYAEAIPALEMAIETTKRKALKARYSFIIGQLKMMTGSKSEAVAYFDQAASWSRDYEMAFNAQMNSKLASMSSGATGEQEITKELEKMLKDDKNAEFKDQIYFQIAKVYLEADNFAKAEEYLKLALENASSNPAQKTEIHYALGDIYYGKDKFDLAYDQYNLALGSMPKTDSRYHKVEERTTNLKGIAIHLKELNLQDSLLMLANLSDDELKGRAAAIIKEKNEKMAAAEEKLNDSKGKGTGSSTIAAASPVASSNSLTSKFFAYNEKDLKKGEREFAKTWGSRALVDDWRRQESDEVEESLDDELDVLVSKNVTNSEVEDIFKNLPRSDEARTSANQQIGEALYNLGMEYRNKLERLDLSSEAFLRFVENHEMDERVPEAYYFLYLNARDENNMTLANQYAAILQDKFPDTKYALIAADPNYINDLLSKKNTVEELYESTYEAFQANEYQQVYDAFNIAKDNFGTGNSYLSKFALLQAMSVGKLQGKDQYIDALRTVVAQYPNTPEQIRAREIIRFLGGDENAFGKEWDDVLSITTFKVEYDKLHYVVVVLHNEDVVSVDDTKIKINTYNNLFHKLEKYSIRSFIVNRDDKTSAILIRKFENKDKAMNYYKEVEGRKKEFVPEGADVEIFAISQFNYREMIKAGGADSYKQFFADNYLRE